MVTAEPATDNNASFLRAARAGNLEKVLEFLKGNIDINTSNANGLNALHLASKEGHVNVVTELLKRGANANAATKKGNTALHIASLAGQYEVVKVLVNLGANVNVQSQNGFTPLYMGAQENHDNVVSFLLANGANQSLATEDGFTPLAVALQQGHDKVVAVLLENDTKGKVRLPALHIAAKKDDCKAATLLLQNDHNPDVTSKSGFTPLHIAAHYGNENIANILLDKGADVNYAAKHQITPLHVASKWGKSNMVTLLLDKRANIEASTRDGLTPLHCAARSGHNQVVDLLLERGAPILAKTKNGLAPLHMASQGDHVDSARILLYHKAPVDDVTVDYLTALHVAAHCGHVKVAKLLLERKADANARALNGFTPLHIACKKNRIKVVELLLKHGASIEATTESGLTPLHVASFMGCMNIVIYLIQNGANPDVPTVRGETPLHLAARANQTDIIRILLRNGANVDARAREEQTPLHIAARLGNVDIVSLLLQHGAAVDATTKDMYTALHIAAKEDQEEVASVLLDHGASLTATTKKGFTPLHLAAKYGNIKVARLLLQKDAPVDAQGKNGVTPLHVASHYDHVNVALLLLDKGASPHAMAKNGYTPLHIAAKKNQMDIATTLLEYGAKANSESKAGFTPLHLASQEGHTDITTLLIEHQADVNFKANNGLTPLHLCAQEDRVNVATVLVKNGAEIGPQTKAGYTPLHVASHFGQINMVRFLLQQNADVHMTTSHGYTPLHQAAQQGHTLVVNLLLENQASPNVTTSQGQTALSIAQRLGYISVVETLKVVTETTVTTTTTTVTEEKYKVVAPETMQETFMTDSEDEGGEDAMLGDQSYRYLTADEMKSLGDDSLPIDVTKDEKQHEAIHPVKESPAPMVEEDHISPQHITPVEVGFSEKYSPDNVDLSRAPVHAGYVRDFDWDDTGYFSLPPQGMLRSSRLKWKTFLVSFMVDARGGAMRGCRHSGVRVIIPPRKASMPMRITCRYLRKEKLIHPPPLMEGEACASRILEVGPVGARFLGPVIIEVPHFASLRGKEREITILRSDTGETWREHTLEASEEAVQEVLNESFEGDELSALEDLNTNRITRILTTDFPQYFAIVTRIRQEVHGVGSEGGMVSSTVVPQVQAIFPDGALTKKIRVGLQAQPIAPELVAKLLGNRVAVSPIVTVEPRRRKFHKPIKLTIPVPQAATKGMINQYSGDAPTLRLLCSITGGSSKAQWEDVTGSTPLTFVNDCVSFTTTVSARFWLMDCRQVNEASKFATELYQEAVHVPFMSKFVIFAKRTEPNEAHLRVFCMTDDKEDKTLETQENFTEIAKSRDVEVLEGKMQYLEFAGNLVPVTKSGEQLKLAFQAFHENRLAFTIRVKDPHVEPMGRIAFMKEPKVGRGEPPQVPICNLNVALPEVVVCDAMPVALELVTLEKRDDFIQESGLSKPESIHRADLRLSDIARELDKDWVALAQQLEISESDINLAKSEFPEDISEQALTMLRLWLQKAGSRATGNELEKALRKINRDDIIKKCMFNVELVTDDVEKAVAKVHLDQSGFDVFKEELGSSREASMRRGASLDISYDEQDIMKDAESAAETSSETGSIFERDQISQVFSDEKENFPLLHDDKPVPVIVTKNGNALIYPDDEIVEHLMKEHEDVTFNTIPDTTEVSEVHEPEDFQNVADTENWIQDNTIVTCVTQDGSENEYVSLSPSDMSSSGVGTLSYSDRLNNSRNEADQHDSMELIETDILLKEEYKSYSEPHPSDSEKLINNTNNMKNAKSQIEDFKETESYFSNDDSTYSSHNEFVENEHPSPLDTSFEAPCYSIQGGQDEEIGKVFNGSSNKLPFEEFTDKITAEIIQMASSAKIDDDFKHGTGPNSLENSASGDVVLPSVPENITEEETADLFIHMDQKEYTENNYVVYDASRSTKNQLLDEDQELEVIHSQDTVIDNVQDNLNEKPDEVFMSGISDSVLKGVNTTSDISSDVSQSLKQETFESPPEKMDQQIFLPEVIKPEVCTIPDEICFEVDPNYEVSCELSKSSEVLPENAVVPLPPDDSDKTEGTSDMPESEDRFIEGARIRRVSKTPPPSPAEVISKDFIEQKSPVEENVLIENEVIEKEEVVAKQEVPTAPPKPIETVDEMMKPMTEVPEVAAKQTESETWPSGEMDTSQVSVSSLPDDEKSETTTATVSSATAADAETETKVVETKEWTETDDSGAVKHVIQKTTHMTLSMQQKSDDRPDEEVPAKEAISETQVSVESGDLLFVDPLLEVISAKTEDEIFRDDGYAVISDQSDFILNFDHDTLEQNATKPKQDNVDDDQETSSYSPYLYEPEVAEYHPGYVIPTTDSLQSDVKSHSLEIDKCFNETKTQDFDSGNSLDQQTEAVMFDLEPRNGHSGYPTLETDVGFHSTVSDFENEPHDIRMTLEEIVSGSINVEPAMGPRTESVKQHRLDDPDFGEAKNFQQVKSDVDNCVLEKESRLLIGLEVHPDLRDPELGKLDIPHEGTVLITELEHEDSPGDLKYSEMSKSYICEPEMSPTKLDHQHPLGDHIHDESSKVSIIELESEPLSVLSHQISFQDRKQSACFESNILETEPAAEIKNQCTYDKLEDKEYYKSSLVEEELQIPYTASVLETEPATEIDNNNIHDDIFVQKTYETSMSEGELEISSGTEIPRYHESSKTSIPGLESGLHTELEHQLFVTDSVVPKSETSVPQFVSESTTNLESEGNMAKDKLEDTHSFEQNEYQEISKPNIPGEQTALSEKSEYEHSSECFESAIAGELYEAKQITESGHPYILQSSEHGAVSSDSESVVHSGFVSESEEKTHDGKPAETVESCGTSQISSGSENTGTHADYETADIYVVPSETGATENELEILNSSCESDLPNVPTLIPYSDEHIRPICFSELIEPHYGAVVDQDKPANESLIHETFEITEDSAVCNIRNLEPNPESNGTTVQPGIPSNLLSYSVPETEDTDQRPFGDFVHDEYQNRQETKEFDTQNAEVESSCSTIHDENLEHCDLDEIIKLPTKYDEPGVTVSQTSQNISCEPDDDDQPDSSFEGNIIKHDSPVEWLITGSKDSLEEICCAPEQQQLQYMSFTSPRPLSSQEVEEMPIKSESIIHHDENLHDEHASPDLLKPESEVVSIEVTSQLPDDMPPEKEPVHVCDTHTELLESKEHPGKATVLTQVTTERLSGPDGSDMLVQSSITTVQSTTTVRTSVEDVSPEPGLLDEFHSEKFVPLAFVNTAFVGADLIDATEEMELSRARSPYEVLREELISKVGEDVKTLADDTGISGDVFLSDMKDYLGSEKIYDHAGQIKHVIKTEVRRRPILQHIPSEISEEDLVEREISSPVSKAEFSPEPMDKNLAEDSDKPDAKTSAFPDDKSERSVTESLVHSHPELKICEEIFPEVIESKEETFSDESGFQTVKRTVVTKTVITKTSQFSGDSADVSDAMRSETSLEYKKSPIPSELVDKDLLESAEEAKVPKDSDIKAGSICETPTEDTHMETEICELTSPESDTGVPASPFECTSEVDFSEGEHKGSEVRDVIIDSKQLSKTEEPKDSLLTSTTFTQSFSEILNVSVAKITDSATDSTLDDRKSAHDSYLSADDSFCDIESISHTSPKKSVVCDTKTDVYEYSCQESFAPQINGPVQVDYKPEYDDEEFRVEELRSVCDVSKAEVLDTVSKTKVSFTEEEMGAPEEFLGAVGGMANTDFVSAEAYKECTSSGAIQRSSDSLADAEPGKPYFYGSVSDDTVDAEIGKILSSKTETEEDIIERPRTPEPPEEVHLPEEVESSIQLRETEVFLADHPIEKTKRTIEGVLDIDVVTNSLKFQLTSSTSHSEWDTVEGIAAHKELSGSASVPGQRTLGELHIESPMQLPTELACPAVGTATDADSTLSPSITQSSCVSEDSSGFVYGMQFEKESEEPEEAMDIDSDQCSDEKDTSYTYGMRFEREHELDDEDDDIPGYGDLYTHQEEDEDVIDEGERVKMQFSSSRPLTYEKPNYSEYDTLAGRKCFGKGNELDDISMSSLQEFEKLEEEIVSGRKSSIGSVDSFNGKQIHSKSGEHDDVSMNSLTEFEKLERECAEAERAEAISQEVNARLSEIEEGHESQSSEASQETISDAAREDDSDVSDFDDRLNKIDKIMKEAQSSVDLFGDKSAVSILSQATDQKSDVFSDDSLSISATAAAKKVEEVTEMTDTGSLQKLPDSSTDASSVGQSYVQEFFHQQTGSPDVISTIVVKEVRNADGSISKVTTTVTEKRQVTKISSTVGADKDIITSSEQTFTIHKKDDIDQDSLHEDKSIKPDSLCGEEKFEYQDSLHEDKSADVDSLQEEVPDIMKDSLHEERPLDEDSLHEMDILPDESSLSLETSLAAALDPCQEPGRSDDSEFAYMLQPQTHDQDVDTDSLKDFNIGDILESAFTTHVHEVALVEGGRVGDAMISSTDSLERSSSAATHATYQFETESVMSSSINSVQTSDDYTMVSSTDTVDPDIKISYGFSGASMSDIHFLTKEGQQKVFIDSEGNIQTQQDLKLFTDLEGNIQNTVMIPSDTTKKASKFPFSESDNYETCTATVTYDEGMKQIKCTSPIVRHQSEDTDESQSEYTDKSSGQFDPDVEIEEIETVDDKGNPVTVRRMKRIITTKSQTFTASSSGDDIEEKFKQFLKDHAGGTDAGKGEEEFEEERKIDEKGNVVIVRTVKQQMLTEPEIHSKSFRGLDAEELSSDFIKSFQMDPTETTEQYERVDDDGNIICVTQKVVMKPEMHTVTFSGSDAHKQMEEYMKQWTASKDDSRSQGSTLMESSPCSSKVTDASQLHYITSQPETAPCDSFGSQISSGETSQSHSIETTVDTQPGHVTTRRIVTTTTTVHHIPEDDPAFPSSPVISGETSDSHQGAHDDSYHLSSEHHSSFQVDDH